MRTAAGSIVFWVVAAMAQHAPAFDAASIKPSKAGVRGYSIRPLPGRLSIGNCSLKALIAAAYHVNDFQVGGGPNWVDSEHYDIEAKAAGDSRPTEKQLMAMLQRLLAERFALTLHRETKELPRYLLEISKSGPKFAESKDAGEPEFRVFQRRQVIARRAPLSYLTEAMAWLLGRPIVDETGLTALYDYKLEWTPDEVQVASDETNARPKDENVPSLSSALQEQMGLRLRSQKGPVEILTVERAERPTAN